jgi:hypothetical protein
MSHPVHSWPASSAIPAALPQYFDTLYNVLPLRDPTRRSVYPALGLNQRYIVSAHAYEGIPQDATIRPDSDDTDGGTLRSQKSLSVTISDNRPQSRSQSAVPSPHTVLCG